MGDKALGIGIAVVGTFFSAVGYTLQKTSHNRADADLAERIRKQQRLAATGSVASPPAAGVTPSAGPSATSPAAIEPTLVTPRKSDGQQREAAAAGDAGGGELKDSPSAGPVASPVAAAAEMEEVKKQSYWRYWQFPAGLTMLIIGAIAAVFVFGLAGQSELAPMGAVTMIFNTILAWRFLGEPFTRIDFIATSLMGIGTTVAIAFGESSDRDYTLDDLIDLLDRQVVWYTFGIMMFLISSCLTIIHVVVGQRRTVDLPKWLQSLDNFARPFVGGSLAGFTGFLTKSSVEVAFNAVSENTGEDWERFELYLFLLALGLCLFMQLKYMNSGLSRYDSLAVIPIYQSVLIISNSTVGLTFFDELKVQSDTSVALFITGCSITTIGIIVLLFKSKGRIPDGRSDAETEVGIVELSAMLGGNATAAAEAVDAGDDAEAAASVDGRRRTSSFIAVDTSVLRGAASPSPSPPHASPPTTSLRPVSPEHTLPNPVESSALDSSMVSVPREEVTPREEEDPSTAPTAV